MTDPAWWREPSGLPLSGRSGDRKVLAMVWMVVFILASTGVAAAVRHRDPDAGLRRFCGSYFAAAQTPALSGQLRAIDSDRPDVQAAMAEEERAFRLARVSGNGRIVRTFGAFEEVLDDALPGATPEEVDAKAARFGETFQASFRAAVEECHSAGYLSDSH